MKRTMKEIKADATLTPEQLEFVKMVANHDLTYDYSDDGRVWRAGQASYDRIKGAAPKFDRAFVVEVWNAMVDTQVIESSRQQFYWN